MGSPRSKKERRNKNKSGAGSRDLHLSERGNAAYESHGDDYGDERPSGLGKSIGAHLQEVMAPYEEAAHKQGKLEELFQLAILAWNIAILPKSEAPEVIEETVNSLRGPSPATLRYIMSDMVDRARRIQNGR